MATNFIIYLLGYLLVIGGVVYGLIQAGVGQGWIIAIVLIMFGLGVVYAMSRAEDRRGEA